MAMVLNEELVMLQESARDFLQTTAPVSHLRQLRDEKNTAGFSTEVWQQMTEMGWPAMVIPEEYGGLGFGYTGMGIVLQETGRCLTPGPLFASGLFAATAILELANEEQKSAWLPSLASGESIVSVAWDETSQYQPGTVSSCATKTDDGWELSGSKTGVISGMGATHFLVSARVAGEDGVSVFRVPADTGGLERHAFHALDTHVLANLELNRVRVEDSSRLGSCSHSQEQMNQVLDAARLGQCAELLGVALESFERTMAYLRERKQFGVPIGSFQALQHRAASLYSEIELCKSLVLHGLQEMDGGQRQLAQSASMTKAKLSEIAMKATAEGIQMHGGIGMTDEFEIGFFYKRARILETLLGDRCYHLDRFARCRAY